MIVIVLKLESLEERDGFFLTELLIAACLMLESISDGEARRQV